MKKSIVIISLMAFLWQACDSLSYHLSFDEVVYVKEFPQKVELEKVAPMDLDLMGCVDFFGNDSVLVFKMMNMEHHWKVYSLPDLKEGVELLKKGNGPNEFVRMPSNEYFQEDANVCRVWSANERKVYQIDISASLQKGKTVLDSIWKLPLEGTAFTCASVDDSSYFVTLFQPDSYKRCLLNGSELQELEHLKPINDVKTYKEINSIAAIRRYEPSQKKVVEVMTHLNQINLYSVEDSFAKTICVGESLTDVGQVDDGWKWAWTSYYGHVMTHPDYFAALYVNANHKDFLSGDVKKVNIQFYNWEGEPLFDIGVPCSAESFFIHRNKDLYVFSANGETECLYKYDLNGLLQNL